MCPLPTNSPLPSVTPPAPRPEGIATSRKVQEENAMFAQEIRGKEGRETFPTAVDNNRWPLATQSLPLQSALTASLSFENEKKTGRVTAQVTQSQREGGENLQGQTRSADGRDGRRVSGNRGGAERRERPRRATWRRRRRRRREISSRLKGGRGVRRREERRDGRT